MTAADLAIVDIETFSQASMSFERISISIVGGVIRTVRDTTLSIILG